MSKQASYKGRRYPSIIMYPEDVLAKKIIEKHWKAKNPSKFAYSDVMRALQRAEAESIKVNGVSLTER